MCVCVCTGVWPCECVCVCGGGGVKGRKPGRVPVCVGGKSWAMGTTFNAPTVNFILFLCSFCLFVQFLLQVYHFKMSIS